MLLDELPNSVGGRASLGDPFLLSLIAAYEAAVEEALTENVGVLSGNRCLRKFILNLA